MIFLKCSHFLFHHGHNISKAIIGFGKIRRNRRVITVTTDPPDVWVRQHHFRLVTNRSEELITATRTCCRGNLTEPTIGGLNRRHGEKGNLEADCTG